MTGKMGTSASGRKHRTVTNAEDLENIVEIELEPPPKTNKASFYAPEPVGSEGGVFTIAMATLDFGDELRDTAFGRTYRGTWQGKNVIIKKLHTESLNDDQVKSAISEATLMIRARPHKHILKSLNLLVFWWS